jgi:O-antigen ligase
MSAAAPSRALTSPVRGIRAQARQRVGAVGERLTLVGDPLRIAMFVLTILTISRVHQHYPAVGKFRPALILVIASVVYAYLHPRFLTRTNVLKLWPMRTMAVLGVLACFSAPFGISLGGSASFILDGYAKTLAYAFLVAVSIRHVRDLYTFVWAYVAACGILAYFSMFVFGLSRGNSYVTRLNNMYTYDSNDVGVVMMVGMALTMLLLGVVRGKRRWLVLLILFGIGATIARSGSRGGFLGFVVAAGAALLLVNSVSASRRMALLGATVIALIAAAPPGYWRQMSTIVQPTQDYNYSSVDGRRALIKRGLGYMAKYPVFGLGINNFGRAECSISPKLARLRIGGPVHCKAPHNSYVEAGAELGIPGFLVWVSLVVGGIFAPLRLRRRLPRSWMRGSEAERFIYGATSFFPVAMIGFAVTSFFVSFAWSDTFHLLCALLAGLYIAARVQMERDSSSVKVGSAQAGSLNPSGGWRVRRSAQLHSPVLP